MKEEKQIKKTESIQEFLARGGVITKLPTKEEIKKKEPMRQNAQGPANFLTYAEADLYYGKAKKAKAAKKQSTIDLSALPEILRKKHLAGMIDEESDEEGIEQEDLSEEE